MHCVSKAFLKSQVRYAVNFLYFLYHMRNFRLRKKILVGEKANFSVHSQSCVECAFIQALGQKLSVQASVTLCITSLFLSSFPERFSKNVLHLKEEQSKGF